MSEARWADATRGTRSSWVSERKDGSQVAVEDEEDNFEVDSAMLAPLQGLSSYISPYLSLSPSPSLSLSHSLSLYVSLPPSLPPSLSLSPASVAAPCSVLAVLLVVCLREWAVGPCVHFALVRACRVPCRPKAHWRWAPSSGCKTAPISQKSFNSDFLK